MPELFGRSFSRREIERRVGSLSQVAGVRMMELRDGREAGVRIAEIRTGSGLRFQVSLDRGLDISMAEYKGMALAWRSAVGDVHPGLFDPRGLGWLRSFPGGLMTGCGLTNAGAPCVDDGEELGLHGALSHSPGSQVKANTEWRGEQCVFSVGGVVHEYKLFKHNLVLYRTIEAELGTSLLTLRDTVVNEGFRSSPIMMLYHINLGWPLLEDNAELLLRARSTAPRDAEATKGADRAKLMSGPVDGYKEQVFYHDLVAGDDGFATALLSNKKMQLGLYTQYRQRELPKFIQWKMTGEGEYVLGMEPANCLVEGRAKERERGTLQFLEPGERRDFVVRIGILDGNSAIDQFTRENNLQ